MSIESMARVPWAFLICLLVVPAFANAQYAGGSGTAEAPFQIATAAQLASIGVDPNDLDKHFRLTADIDLGAFTGTDFNRIGSGAAFRGVFDGDGHAVSGFTWRSEGISYVGLFGYVNDPNAEIRNLTLVSPEVDAGSGRFVGALIGCLGNGTVTNCAVDGGHVVGGAIVGGLAGANGYRWPYPVIRGCHSTCTVTGDTEVGGLVGEVIAGAVADCYASGPVTGRERIGGLVGSNWQTIDRCYAAGVVTGEDCVGGLVGYNQRAVANCYAVGAVTGEDHTGGLAGENAGTIRNGYAAGAVGGNDAAGGLVGGGSHGAAIASFWDTERSGQSTSAGGTGRTTVEMRTPETFLGWGACGSETVWTIQEGQDYPRLAWENRFGQAIPTISLADLLAGRGTADEPYLVATAEDLNSIGVFPCEWDKHFRLVADIDLAAYAGTEFNVIGVDWGVAFTGVFDGNGHRIANLCYCATHRTRVGLFGFVSDPNATIRNLGLENATIEAGTGYYAGALVGAFEYGTIANCYVEGGAVCGVCEVGGVVGANRRGTLTNCYVTGAVTGQQRVGGLMGTNHNGVVSCCYSTAALTVGGSGDDAGGLIGSSFYGSVLGSFWDIEASGKSVSAGGVGRTTAQMKTANTFLGWNGCGGEGIWTIDDGNDYPRLAWEGRPGQLIGSVQLSDLLTGDGTKTEPFRIYTTGDLNVIGYFPCEWDKHFALMADINSSGLTGAGFNRIGISSDYPFTGTFDGNHHAVMYFTYEALDEDAAGLFGYISDPNAEVRNLRMIDPRVDAGTGDDVGALVGAVGSGTIRNCCAEGGLVSGRWCTGGLVGRNDAGTVANCYATGDVAGDERVGGLAGCNYNGVISNCYSVGSVTANTAAGGLVGYNKKTIVNSYTASGVTGRSDVGGLAGFGYDAFVYDCFWDRDVAGGMSSRGGRGQTTAEMMTAATFLKAGWDFVDEKNNGTEDLWRILEGRDYPRLWWELPGEKASP